MLGDPAGHRPERLVQRVGLVAAGLREVGPAAALAADLLGHRLDQVARADAVGVVLGVTPAARRTTPSSTDPTTTIALLSLSL